MFYATVSQVVCRQYNSFERTQDKQTKWPPFSSMAAVCVSTLCMMCGNQQKHNNSISSKNKHFMGLKWPMAVANAQIGELGRLPDRQKADQKELQ